nr:MAG TPA: hypothetical protein [Caudoviricetes sp.]
MRDVWPCSIFTLLRFYMPLLSLNRNTLSCYRSD